MPFWVAIFRHVLQVGCSKTLERFRKPVIKGILELPGSVLRCVTSEILVSVPGFELISLFVLFVEHVLPDFAAKLTHFSNYYKKDSKGAKVSV